MTDSMLFLKGVLTRIPENVLILLKKHWQSILSDIVNRSLKKKTL